MDWVLGMRGARQITGAGQRPRETLWPPQNIGKEATVLREALSVCEASSALPRAVHRSTCPNPRSEALT